MSDLPFDYPDAAAPNPAAPNPKCRRHGPWVRTMVEGDPSSATPFVCESCGHVKDPVKSRRGRLNKSRGLSIQRQVAAELEMDHIPGSQKADARDALFNAEIKSGPSWYSLRVEAELDDLPTGRMPLFVAASTPGPGHKRRVYVTVSLGDLVKMVGPHAQVSAWAPDWVALKRPHVEVES